MYHIAANLLKVRLNIKKASPVVELVAVSKFRTVEEIEVAVAAGQRIFGENRVQEAQQKWPAIKRQHPDVRLHLIGPLQTNKVKDALKVFDVIEVVDRPKLAEALLKEMRAQGTWPECYVQVNTGAEPQKAGVLPEEADTFIRKCVADGLPIVGLMCIPPEGQDPVPHFTMLQEMAARHGLKNLSRGLSADYEAAIACGATHVRVGTAIFGKRQEL
jgi:pyridoxal phosphate enzyme (YggS family)